MLYKTLIIFDTNKVRHVQGKKPCYHDFILGGDFKIIHDFIQENGLGDLVHVGVPKFVLDELLEQKIKQFEEDILLYNSIGTNLSKIGGIHADFDKKRKELSKYLKSRRVQFFIDHSIRILSLPKKVYAPVLESIAKRSIAKNAPFKTHGKASDVGFKDVLIWETILNNPKLISKYDNIVFYSGDNIFADCKDEFRAVFNRGVDFSSESGYLIEKMKVLYAEFLENKDIYDFIKTDYFKDSLKQSLADLGISIQNDTDVQSGNFRIIDICSSLEREDIEDYDILFRIGSKIEIRIENEKKLFSVFTTINQNKEFIDFEIE